MSAAYRTLEQTAVARATAALNSIQRLGGSIGIALLAVVLEHQMTDHLPHAAGGSNLGALTQAPSAVKAQVAPLLAESFGHTFWWTVALTVITLVPPCSYPARGPARPYHRTRPTGPRRRWRREFRQTPDKPVPTVDPWATVAQQNLRRRHDALVAPERLVLGYYDAAGTLIVAGSAAPLSPCQRKEIVPQRPTHAGAHPWPTELPTGWVGAYHLTHLIRARPDLEPHDVSPPPGVNRSLR